MQALEPAGQGLRSPILGHNPLWQLTFHRSEISWQGHPKVLCSPSPQCVVFKTSQTEFYVQCDALPVSKKADVPKHNYDKPALKPLKIKKDCHFTGQSVFRNSIWHNELFEFTRVTSFSNVCIKFSLNNSNHV